MELEHEEEVKIRMHIYMKGIHGQINEDTLS